MPYTLSAEQERRVQSLFPKVVTHAQPVSAVVDALLDFEAQRRGQPEGSGAFARNALLYGGLIDGEYDHSTHSFGAGFHLQAVMVDPITFIRVNMRYGFKVGDAALAAAVQTLARSLPGAKVVRLHEDAFAALLGASSGLSIEAQLADRLRTELEAAVRAVLPDDGESPMPLLWSVAQLDLTVQNPSHVVVLGPLTYAECDRALLLEKRQPGTGLQRRTVDLAGGV